MKKPVRTDLVLINPPFLNITQPPHSIAYLYAYLKKKGRYNVVQYDWNIEFYNFALSEERLRKILSEVNQRLGKLDSKRVLTKQERMEWSRSYAALNEPFWNSQIDMLSQWTRTLKSGDGYDLRKYREAVDGVCRLISLVSISLYPFRLFFEHFRLWDHDYSDFPCYTDAFFNTDKYSILKEFYSLKVKELAQNVVNPRIIGLSAIIPGQLSNSLFIIPMLRRAFKGCRIIAGGPAITAIAKNIVDYNYSDALLFNFDAVVMGDGETALEEYLRMTCLNERENNKKINNVIHVDRARRKFTANPVTYLHDLDIFPPPDFTGMPLNEYFSPELVLCLSPTRGCYWCKCRFCKNGYPSRNPSTPTAPYREKSVELFVEDLQHMIRKYKTNNFTFSGDVTSPAYLSKLADELSKRNIRIRYSSYLRMEPVFADADFVKKLSRSGLKYVTFGVESASQHVLDLINKGTPVRYFNKIIDNFHNNDVILFAFVFHDFPGETLKDSLKTLRFMYRNRNKLFSPLGMQHFYMRQDTYVFHHFKDFDIKRIEPVRHARDYGALYLEYIMAKEYKTDKDRTIEQRYYDNVARHFVNYKTPWLFTHPPAHNLLFSSKYGRKLIVLWKELKSSAAADDNYIDLNELLSSELQIKILNHDISGKISKPNAYLLNRSWVCRCDDFVSMSAM